MNSEEMWRHVRTMTEWLDQGSTPTSDPRILRCFKIAEELGEVTAAIIGATGQNPRKGITHTWLDVQEELCDVILAAMVALDSVGGNAQQQFERHVQNRLTRIMAMKAPKCACCGGGVVCEDENGNWCGNCVGRCSPGEGMPQ